MKHFVPTPTPEKLYLPLFSDRVPAGFPSPALFPFYIFYQPTFVFSKIDKKQYDTNQRSDLGLLNYADNYHYKFNNSAELFWRRVMPY